jgi:large-conductance mechanosensitive channel
METHRNGADRLGRGKYWKKTTHLAVERIADSSFGKMINKFVNYILMPSKIGNYILMHSFISQ